MTSVPPPLPRDAAPALPSTKKSLAVVVTVGVLSTAAAFGIDASQAEPLGDQPVAMILCGCLLAFVAAALRRDPPVPLGLAAMAGFPVWAAIDLAINGGHNLLPFEFAIYAVYAGLGVVVAIVARRWRS